MPILHEARYISRKIGVHAPRKRSRRFVLPSRKRQHLVYETQVGVTQDLITSIRDPVIAPRTVKFMTPNYYITQQTIARGAQHVQIAPQVCAADLFSRHDISWVWQSIQGHTVLFQPIRDHNRDARIFFGHSYHTLEAFGHEPVVSMND